MTQSTVQIAAAPAERRMGALHGLLRHLNAGEQKRVIAEILAGTEEGALAGLFEAYRNGRPVGAVWAQTQPGSTALMWPPRLAEGEDDETAARLLAAACQYLQQQRVVVVQALLAPASDSPTGGGESARLAAAGFAHLADLVYLMCAESSFPMYPPAGPLEFQPYGQANHARLANIVVRTYEQTLDCPQLNGIRHMDDILAGYRATGQFDPSDWLVVRRNGHDVGCLLLADHPRMGHVELVYMGVTPEARGNGYGLVIVRHAQWLTRTHGRSRLVLAADERNRPALTIYETAGFVGWEKRSVWMRAFSARHAD